MGIKKPRQAPRYSDGIHGRVDYDYRAYDGETDVDINARLVFLDSLFDAPPKVRSYLLRGIDRRGKVPPIDELVEFVNTTLAPLGADGPFLREPNLHPSLELVEVVNTTLAPLGADGPFPREPSLQQSLLTIWRHGEGKYFIHGEQPVTVTPTDEKILSLFADSLVARSRDEIEAACKFENAPRAISQLNNRHDGMFKRGIRRPGKKGGGGYLICVKQVRDR